MELICTCNSYHWVIGGGGGASGVRFNHIPIYNVYVFVIGCPPPPVGGGGANPPLRIMMPQEQIMCVKKRKYYATTLVEKSAT